MCTERKRNRAFRRVCTAAVLAVLLMIEALTGSAIQPETHAYADDIKPAAATPSQDGQYVAEVIDTLSGGDGLFKEGLNGIDMYEHLGCVYMGWRTTGGTWQNYIIENYIMDQLENAGYTTSDADTVAPYGSKSESDRSDDAEGDFAWLSMYQGTNKHKLGNVWDPEYASLEVEYAKADGTPVNDEVRPEGAVPINDLLERCSGSYWSFDPTTEVYQKHFAEQTGMDYERDIASLAGTEEKVRAMHEKLMTSDKDRDSRKTVDDYKYIARPDITFSSTVDAMLNKRTRLARESCFTDPAGTDPEHARGSKGEFAYVGTIDPNDMSNSENISPADLKGKIIITDSDMYTGFVFADYCDAAGVASKEAVDSFLTPRDKDGSIMEPWYDSSRYAGGVGASTAKKCMEEGRPIVEWQLSNRQYDSLRELLKRAEEYNKDRPDDEKVHVTGNQIAIGSIYYMTKADGSPGKGQAVAVAEVKGTVSPEKRVIICAHVQEPGSNDNATGVASLINIATTYKKLIDSGKIARPKCTITFMWGDEMNMADCWMSSHPEEKKSLIGALDMDMAGEDPDKTGGVMRIEKTPDPSAKYGYTVDSVPWNEPDRSICSLSNPYYDKSYRCRSDGSFVRLPDSHTLWGALSSDNIFNKGWYLNDLYMYVTSTVINRHDPDFKVKVCPYEGGSDHSTFLIANIPALLTWHFTDYSYHTSSDTLYMSSPRELESVGITTLATALTISEMCEDSNVALEVLNTVKEAALIRMDTEKINSDHHLTYVKAGNSSYEKELAGEKEVLTVWGTWYDEALESVLNQVAAPSDDLKRAAETARRETSVRISTAVSYADKIFRDDEEAKKREEEKKRQANLTAARKKAAKAAKPVVKVKALKDRKAKITWKKMTLKYTANGKSGKMKVSGYVVYRSLKKNKGYKKIKTLKKAGSVKYTDRKLKKGRKYYYKVKTYTIINGKKVYGRYSKAKAVRIRK